MVPTVAVVVVLLLVASLQNLGEFHGLLGLAWIEVYASPSLADPYPLIAA